MIFCKGCTAIRSTGDGTVIARNVIRYKPGAVLITARGFQFDYENIHYSYRDKFTVFFQEAAREFSSPKLTASRRP